MNDTVYDPFFSLQYEHEREKTDHRRSRKSNRRKTMAGILPIGAKRKGKKWLHRYNRRKQDVASNYYKHKAYSYGSIYWYMS